MPGNSQTQPTMMDPHVLDNDKSCDYKEATAFEFTFIPVTCQLTCICNKVNPGLGLGTTAYLYCFPSGIYIYLHLFSVSSQVQELLEKVHWDVSITGFVIEELYRFCPVPS